MSLHILLIAHFLGDFTLQSALLAHKKTLKFRYLLGHALIYALVMGIAAFVTLRRAWLPFAILTLSHFLIDWLRVAIDKKAKKAAALFVSFAVDQALHIAVIVLTVLLFPPTFTPWFSQWAQQLPLADCLRYALLFVVIWDPASVLVKKLSVYVSGKPAPSIHSEEAPVGSIIGKMERLIVAILVLCGEIGAIGFVLTAKSLARYKQLSEKDFAEKYLIGTLTSTAIAIIAALLLK